MGMVREVNSVGFLPGDGGQVGGVSLCFLNGKGWKDTLKASMGYVVFRQVERKWYIHHIFEFCLLVIIGIK